VELHCPNASLVPSAPASLIPQKTLEKQGLYYYGFENETGIFRHRKGISPNKMDEKVVEIKMRYDLPFITLANEPKRSSQFYGTCHSQYIKMRPAAMSGLTRKFIKDLQEKLKFDSARMHKTLGHVSMERLRYMIRHRTTADLPLSAILDSECTDCTKGKMQRSPFHILPPNNHPVGSALHIDVCKIGPDRFNNKYFVYIIDDRSKKSWMYQLRLKSDALVAVIQLIEQLNSTVDRPIRVRKIRMDRGELFSTAFLNYCGAHNILVEPTLRKTPEADGTAESHIKVLEGMMRTLIAGAPNLCALDWDVIGPHANEVKNKLPVTSKDVYSPDEEWHGVAPYVTHYKIPGCAVEYHLEKSDTLKRNPTTGATSTRRKLDPKTAAAVYVGHASRTHVKLIDIASGKLITRRHADCRFDESRFPMIPSRPVDSTNVPDAAKLPLLTPNQLLSMTSEETRTADEQITNYLKRREQFIRDPLSHNVLADMQRAPLVPEPAKTTPKQQPKATRKRVTDGTSKRARKQSRINQKPGTTKNTMTHTQGAPSTQPQIELHKLPSTEDSDASDMETETEKTTHAKINLNQTPTADDSGVSDTESDITSDDESSDNYVPGAHHTTAFISNPFHQRISDSEKMFQQTSSFIAEADEDDTIERVEELLAAWNTFGENVSPLETNPLGPTKQETNVNHLTETDGWNQYHKLLANSHPARHEEAWNSSTVNQHKFPSINPNHDKLPKYISEEEANPKNRKSAMASRHQYWWKKAEEEEKASLEITGTFRERWISELPPGANIVGSKYVYKCKTNADGTVERFKVRLVAQGFTQRHGVDYSEVYAPVIRRATLRLFLALCAQKGWANRMIDISTAYLNGVLEETIFMKPPEGFGLAEGKVLQLVKGLYGLKQAGRVWYQTLVAHLKGQGYSQSRADPCVFFKSMDGKVVYMLTYVDDICFFGDQQMIERAIADIRSQFKIRDLGPIKMCLGIEVERDTSGIYIHQSKYIHTILKRFKNCMYQHQLHWSANTPMRTGKSTRTGETHLAPHFKGVPIQVTTRASPRLEPGDESYNADADHPFDRALYQEALGCLNYLTVNTRPDLAVSLSIFSMFTQNPAVKHWNGLMHVMRYIEATRHYAIFYDARHPSKDPIGCADAAYALHHDGRSQIGYMVWLANGAVSWKSSKPPATILSAMEAEYIAISELGREIQAIVNIYVACDLPLNNAIKVLEDNRGVLSMCVSDTYTNRSKHININYHHIRDLIQHGIIEAVDTRSINQPADGLTKPLGPNKFPEFREQMGLRTLPPHIVKYIEEVMIKMTEGEGI
jgi:hypothetical protein